MLNWLSSQKTHDNPVANTTAAAAIAADVEQPETPAHTFAIRAFRHAIYGTPNTVQPKPRRRSNDTTRAARPRIVRPKSTSDAQTIGSLDVAASNDHVPSPLPSPTKGILLTPGTATARRKTVSFGDHVVDNENKRPLKSGLPDDCPGKFPSPWEKSFMDLDQDEATVKPRGRKLNEAFEQVREESAKRKSKSGRQKKPKEDADLTTDLAEPVSESGRYWKQEYDIYRERTTAEVRKLVEKNRLAKRYARDKDTECTDMREELHREQKKVERLEQRMGELEGLLKEFQAQSQSAQPSGTDLQERLDFLSRNSITAGIQQVADEVDEPVTEKKPARPERRIWKHIVTQQVQERKLEPGNVNSELLDTGCITSIPVARKEATPSRTRPRARRHRTKSEDNTGAHTTAASENAKLASQPDIQPSAKQDTVEEAALKPANVNTLTEQTHSIALSMGLQPPSPTRERRQDSPMRPTAPLSSSPEVLSKSLKRPLSPMKSTENNETKDVVLEPSLFQPDAVSERPDVLTGNPVPVRTAIQTGSRRLNTKENDGPCTRTQHPRANEQQKPSVAWQAMSAAPEHVPAATDPDGKPMPPDRLAAAKARLASRGRQVS